MKFVFVFCGVLMLFLAISGGDVEKNVETTTKFCVICAVVNRPVISAPSVDCPNGKGLDQNGDCVRVDVGNVVHE